MKRATSRKHPTGPWWRAVEEGTIRKLSPSAMLSRRGLNAPPEWLLLLTQAYSSHINFHLSEARTHLEGVRTLLQDDAWKQVGRLLELAVVVRESDSEKLEGLIPQVKALLRDIPGPESQTRARAWHLLGVICIRLNLFEEAETALTEAIKLVVESPSRTWILDGWGQLLLAQGAWSEGIRTMSAVIQRRKKSGDALGMAISTGHLALVDLTLGSPIAAETSLRLFLKTYGGAIPLISRLRLQTFLLQACIDQDAADRSATEAAIIVQLLKDPSIERHYLRGYAMLALARAAHLTGDAPAVKRWLVGAKEFFTLPDQVSRLCYWEARLLPDDVDWGHWPGMMRALFAKSASVSEAELLSHLLLAERAAAAGGWDEVVSYLDLASERALESNNLMWLELVDSAFRKLDPRRMGDRLVRRYSGRTLRELQGTTKEEATIIFADLVGFTPRAAKLPPEEVMSTVRSVFEMSVGLLTVHHVRPLSYLGDGLLAVAQGPGHQRRGLEFSMAIVRKARRATLVRGALGEKWGLDLRAGVASGPVVLGVLGNLFKMEYAAIGLTTNLASRLEGKANPNEVLCSLDTARGASAAGPVELLELKGVPRKVKAVRFVVDA